MNTNNSINIKAKLLEAIEPIRNETNTNHEFIEDIKSEEQTSRAELIGKLIIPLIDCFGGIEMAKTMTEALSDQMSKIVNDECQPILELEEHQRIISRLQRAFLFIAILESENEKEVIQTVAKYAHYL